jgi:hypothetical protein
MFKLELVVIPASTMDDSWKITCPALLVYAKGKTFAATVEELKHLIVREYSKLYSGYSDLSVKDIQTQVTNTPMGLDLVLPCTRQMFTFIAERIR